MHEFSLAQTVLETIVSVAKQKDFTKIKKIILKFGAFALIQEDQFRFCFEIVQQSIKMTEKTELQIEWVPGELKCLNCNFEGKIENLPQDHNELAPIFQCPKCKSYKTEILSGTETVIDSIIV